MNAVKYVKSSERYKECSPEDTIHRIREILYNNNLFVLEFAWFHEKNWASLGLELEDLPINTNGKGANEKYALASAYAELMERLQNMILVNTDLGAGNQTLTRAVFTDEVPFDYSKLRKEHPEILKYMFSITDLTQLEDILAGESFHSRPFYNVNTGAVEYLPKELLSLAVGSNGMCAGNTPVEALIQGVCEIFERYVLKEIYYNPQVALPLIPDEFMQQFPQWKYFEIIRANGFEIYAKDCSLGGKVPVVGVLICKDDKAVFNLGASPDFAVAVQRCVTEMFQGYELDSIAGKLQPITTLNTAKTDRIFTDPQKRSTYQFYKTLRSYAGVVSPVIFNNSQKFNPDCIFQCDDLTNQSTLTGLFDIIKQFNYEIFIRDVSFLGFPTYQIYIPGMSEIINHDLEELKLRIKDIPKARKTFFNLANSSQNDIAHLAQTLDKIINYPYIDKSFVFKMLHNLMFKDKTPIGNIDPENILVMLYYKSGDSAAAHRVLTNYLKQQLTPEQFKNPPAYALDHLCLLSFLEILKDGGRLDDCKKLQNKFPAEIIDEIYNTLKETANIAEFFGIPACVSCNDCEYRPLCCLDQLKAVAAKLQKRIDEYRFDQMAIRQYVS